MSWWASKIAGQTPAPQQPPQQAPQAYQQPQQPVYYQQQAAPPPGVQYVVQPPQPGPAPVQYQPQEQISVMDALRQKLITPIQAASMWRGGKGVRTETERCPECGSDHYFTRKKVAGVNGHPPAPYCHGCGYNGMFEQYGAIDIDAAEGN
jgi:hypothetical protein